MKQVRPVRKSAVGQMDEAKLAMKKRMYWCTVACRLSWKLSFESVQAIASAAASHGLIQIILAVKAGRSAHHQYSVARYRSSRTANRCRQPYG